MGFEEVKASGINELSTIISPKHENFGVKLGFHHKIKLNEGGSNLVFAMQ